MKSNKLRAVFDVSIVAVAWVLFVCFCVNYQSSMSNGPREFAGYSDFTTFKITRLAKDLDKVRAWEDVNAMGRILSINALNIDGNITVRDQLLVEAMDDFNDDDLLKILNSQNTLFDKQPLDVANNANAPASIPVPITNVVIKSEITQADIDRLKACHALLKTKAERPAIVKWVDSKYQSTLKIFGLIKNSCK